jgi:hypothetical protein
MMEVLETYSFSKSVSVCVCLCARVSRILKHYHFGFDCFAKLVVICNNWPRLPVLNFEEKMHWTGPGPNNWPPVAWLCLVADSSCLVTKHFAQFMFG